MSRQAADWRETFAKDTRDKGWRFKIQKGHLKLKKYRKPYFHIEAQVSDSQGKGNR